MKLSVLSIIIFVCTFCRYVGAIDLEDADGNGITDRVDAVINDYIKGDEKLNYSDLESFAKSFYVLVESKSTDKNFEEIVFDHTRMSSCFETKYPERYKEISAEIMANTMFTLERSMAYINDLDAQNKYIIKLYENGEKFECDEV